MNGTQEFIKKHIEELKKLKENLADMDAIQNSMTGKPVDETEEKLADVAQRAIDQLEQLLC